MDKKVEIILQEHIMNNSNSKKRDAQYRKYTGDVREDYNIARFISINALAAISLFVVGNFTWLVTQSTPKTMLWGAKNRMYTPYKKAIHDAYIPVDKYRIDDNTYKTGQLNVNQEPGFRAHGTWLANLLFSLWILSGTAYLFKSSKNDFDTIDMMMEFKKMHGNQYKLTDKQIAKLVSASNEIIARMSAEERAYFDMLSSENLKIKDNKVFADMAVAILDGYLRTHPEETQKIVQIYANNKAITKGLNWVTYLRTR